MRKLSVLAAAVIMGALALTPAAAGAASRPAPSRSAAHRIEWKRSGLCVGTRGGRKTAATPAVLEPCSAAPGWVVSGESAVLAGTREMLLMDVRKGGLVVLGTRPRAWRTWRYLPGRHVLEEVWLSRAYHPRRVFGLCSRRERAGGTLRVLEWTRADAAKERWTLIGG